MYSGTGEHDDLDAVDQLYDGQLNRKWSPRFSTTLYADYLFDERRERELSETGLLFSDDRRRRQTFGLSGQYLVSEKAAVSLAYNCSIEEFDDERTYDLEVHTLQMLVTRSLAPVLDRVTGRLQLVGGLYEYRRDYDTSVQALGVFPIDGTVDDAQTIDYYSASLGLAYNWSTCMQLTADIGTRFTRSRRTLFADYGVNPFMPDSSTSDENESWGYVANLECIRFNETGQFSVMASHDLVPASGRDGATERTSLKLSGSVRLSGDWHADGSARGYLNRSDESGVGADENELTVELRAGLRYAFDPRLSMGAYWRCSWLDDRKNHEDKTQNTVTVQLQWNWPIFE